MDTNFQPVQEQTTAPQTIVVASKSSNGLLLIVCALLLISLMANLYFFSKMFSGNQIGQPQSQQIPMVQIETQPTVALTVAPTIVTIVSPQIDIIKNWKTYTETREVKFTIDYPTTWKVDAKDAMNGGKHTSFDSGNERVGIVSVQWNAQPVEPNCNTSNETREKIQIADRIIEMCHATGSSQEPEGYFYNGVQNGVSYSIVTSNYPGVENRNIILKILATLKI